MTFANIKKQIKCFDKKYTVNSSREGIRYIDKNTMKCKGVVYNWPRSDLVKDFIDNIDDSEYLMRKPLKRVYHKDTNIVEWKYLGIMVVIFEDNKLPDSLLVYNGVGIIRIS